MLRTLKGAVIDQINEFYKQGGPFSIHTITKKLRDKVNNGSFMIYGIKIEQINSFIETQKITHDQVKEVFSECVLESKLDNFATNFNGQYTIYTPIPAATDDVVQAPIVIDANAGISRIVNEIVSDKIRVPHPKAWRIRLNNSLWITSRGKAAWSRKCDASLALFEDLLMTRGDLEDSVGMKLPHSKILEMREIFFTKLESVGYKFEILNAS